MRNVAVAAAGAGRRLRAPARTRDVVLTVVNGGSEADTLRQSASTPRPTEVVVLRRTARRAEVDVPPPAAPPAARLGLVLRGLTSDLRAGEYVTLTLRFEQRQRRRARPGRRRPAARTGRSTPASPAARRASPRSRARPAARRDHGEEEPAPSRARRRPRRPPTGRPARAPGGRPRRPSRRARGRASPQADRCCRRARLASGAWPSPHRCQGPPLAPLRRVRRDRRQVARAVPASARPGARSPRSAPTGVARSPPAPVSAPAPRRPIAEVDVEAAPAPATGVGELDRVLGGGLVARRGRAAGRRARRRQVDAAARGGRTRWRRATAARTVLYVTGEESAAQVGCGPAAPARSRPASWLAAETDLGAVLAHVDADEPDLLVVDSVQTIASAAGRGRRRRRDPGAGGRPPALIAGGQGARHRHVLVGHVTKDGAVAGPARCSSTSSTSSCTSRATGTPRCAWCGR